uniref:Post-GPI attachment to proteins factor 3 n=1 Tax=Strongyloides venezuelensis TaxID=75913 RepID=A0A0K0F9N3_STRVS
MYKYTKPLIILSCHEKNESLFKSSLDLTDINGSNIESSTCFTYKIALFSFGVFNVVRIISFYYEKMLFKSMKSCYMKQDFPCLHMGSMIGAPYICYQLCYNYSAQYGGQFLFLYVLSIALMFVMYPYIKGFVCLIRSISFCLKNKFFSHWFELYTSLMALFIYGSLILTTFLHLIFSIPPSIFVFGYPIHYPYVNLSLIIFLMHHYIIRSHKEISPIIYKVIEEDIYVYAQRFKCINGSICGKESNVYILSKRPSIETNITWDIFNFNENKSNSYNVNSFSNKIGNNRIVTVRNMNELDGWIIRKLRDYIPQIKINVSEKYY